MTVTIVTALGVAQALGMTLAILFRFREQGLDHQERLTSTVQDLRNNLDGFGLGEPERAELEAEVRTLEAQADSPRPKREVVRPSLQSAKNILEGTASGATVQGVIQG